MKPFCLQPVLPTSAYADALVARQSTWGEKLARNYFTSSFNFNKSFDVDFSL